MTYYYVRVIEIPTPRHTLYASVDIYFGPKAPKGMESNWIKTNPGSYWFTYFRLYAPTESYFDRSWPMYDIEEVR